MGILSLLASLKPGWIRTCNLGDFGVSLKVPYAYANVSINREGNLLYLYNEENEIIISGIDVGKGFWKSDLPEERIDEYIKDYCAYGAKYFLLKIVPSRKASSTTSLSSSSITL